MHVVESFTVPPEWLRFESMDHGANNPTAWHVWAVDHDGNVVVFDEYYSPGLVSAHAAEILARRHRDWQPQPWIPYAFGGSDEQSNRVWADPSVKAEHGLTGRFGEPASILREYREHGLYLSLAQNDRQAGYARLRELLHVEPGRIPPEWAHVPSELGGAPRLYVFKGCERLIEQLRSAPVATEGANAGKAIDDHWESAHGHAVASARYGALSWPRPPEQPEERIDDPRRAAMIEIERQLAENLELGLPDDEDDWLGIVDI